LKSNTDKLQALRFEPKTIDLKSRYSTNSDMPPPPVYNNNPRKKNITSNKKSVSFINQIS
jgi:hypothetical protein